MTLIDLIAAEVFGNNFDYVRYIDELDVTGETRMEFPEIAARYGLANVAFFSLSTLGAQCKLTFRTSTSTFPPQAVLAAHAEFERRYGGWIVPVFDNSDGYQTLSVHIPEPPSRIESLILPFTGILPHGKPTLEIPLPTLVPSDIMARSNGEMTVSLGSNPRNGRARNIKAAADYLASHLYAVSFTRPT